MNINLKQLSEFLVEAKKKTYAGIGREIKPQRPGFKELEFRKGNWYYRDSYAGFFFAPGQEYIKFRGKIIWVMAYSGGMEKKYHGNVNFALEVFGFLKNVLGKVNPASPYRGPKRMKVGNFLYINITEGNMKKFKGHEKILYKNKLVFQQDYIGGLIVSK